MMRGQIEHQTEAKERESLLDVGFEPTHADAYQNLSLAP
jgi:hypothetical protein